MPLIPEQLDHPTVENGVNDFFGNPTTGRNAKILRYPDGNFSKQHGWVVFRELTEVNDPEATLKTRTVPTGNSVYLYLPKEGISVGDKADYESASLGVTGTIIETADTSDLNIGTALNVGTKSISDAFVVLSDPEASSLPLVSKMLQTLKNITPQPINQGARSRIKRTANPQLRALFNQVDRRSFSYSFEFVPDNPKEAKLIREIVNFFRKNLYPEVEGIPDGGEFFSDFVYKFPNKFEIEYYFNQKRIGHRILPCYLESVKVQYSNQGTMSFFPDGEFISTKIDLNFIEERALSKERIDPNNFSDGVSY